MWFQQNGVTSYIAAEKWIFLLKKSVIVMFIIHYFLVLLFQFFMIDINY